MPRVQQLGQGEDRPRIAVVGCGGAGCNTVRHLPPTPGLEVIGLNDMPHPSLLGVRHRMLISEEELVAVATLDDAVAKGLETNTEKEIARELIGFDMVVAIAGLGGNTGGNGANAVARVARHHNMTTWAVVTLPFKAEGVRRRMASQDSLDRLRKRCPGTLTFANDKLLDIAPDVPLGRAFAVMSQVMIKPIESMSRVLTKADVPILREFFGGCRELRLGIGEAFGSHRSFAAVEEAVSSPWIDFDLERSRRAIIMMSGSEMSEALVNDVLHSFSLKAPGADVLCGSFAEGQGEKLTVSALVSTP